GRWCPNGWTKKRPPKRGEKVKGISVGCWRKRGFRSRTLQGARNSGERPRNPRAAEQRDELTPFHYSITSSARRRSDVGNVIPKLLAVFTLMTSSNFVGNSAGSSAGLAPRSTLATRAPP